MCPTPPSCDHDYMVRALSLAEGVRGHVWPNPPVGCVIVKHGEIVAEAATHPGGRPHAERKALDSAGDGAASATLYVTLEPCSHWGKTPPCADAIIEAGIARVVCAVQDPAPRVNGAGFDTLIRGGVDVSIGMCREAAERVMSGFFHRVHTGVPEIVAQLRASGAVPRGVDAVLAASDRGVTLTTRAGKTDCVYQSADEALRWMGELGLTTVAIPQNDPLWRDGWGVRVAAMRQEQIVARNLAPGLQS